MCPSMKEPFDVRDKRYSNGGNAAVLAQIPSHAREVLDVGCGTGTHARILAARGAIVDGITLSADELAEAAPDCRMCWIHDLETGFPQSISRAYDIVLCSHVLEHLRWPERLLLEARRLLTPAQGRIVAAVPNVLFYKNRARLLSGSFEYEEAGIMDASHFRWFTFASARALFERCGYEVVTHLGDGNAPIPCVRRLLPRSATQKVDAAATRLLPGMFASQIIVVATPRS
jgi:SAM-dependent methyltransferase